MNSQFLARGTTGEIWLYDQIGASFWGDGISAKQFQKELSALGKVSQLHVRINSPGGDVFDGLAIYNLLREHPARVVVDVDGLAASIASVIAMAGAEVRMASNAMMMIHDPHSMAIGNADEMQRVAALLTQIKGSLADTYAQRTGHDRKRLEAWMSAETWFTADDAVQHKFADVVAREQPVAACFGLLGHYRNVPAALRAQAASRGTRDRAAVQVNELTARLAARGLQ